MRRGLPLLLALAAAAAQDLPKGVVGGVVVDGVTDQPVRRAGVVLTGEADGRRVVLAAVETEADGAFRFERLAAGVYSLVAQKAGYLDLPRSGRMSQLPLADGQQRAGLVVRLTPQSVISGRVLDEDGEPLQGASVTLMRRSQGIWLDGATGRADDRGAYRFPDLVAGEYSVVASYADPMLARKSGAAVRPRVFLTTYYPGAAALSGAQGIVVVQGAETDGIDVRLRRETAYRVRVRVEGPEVQQDSVYVLGRDGRTRAGVVVKTAEPRVFDVVGLPAGSWFVVADGYSKSDEWFTGFTPIELSNADAGDVVVRLGDGIPVSGQFAYEGPEAARPKWPGIRVRLTPPDGMRPSQQTCEVGESSAFAVHVALPGRYVVEPEGVVPKGVYLASVKISAEEYYGKQLDLIGGPLEAVTILYLYGSAKLGGSWEGPLGASAEERGVVVLAPVEPHLRRAPYLLTTPIQPDGRFQFEGVRPGEYLVCHTLDGEISPLALETAVRLKVEPRGAHSVQLSR